MIAASDLNDGLYLRIEPGLYDFSKLNMEFFCSNWFKSLVSSSMVVCHIT